LEASIKGSVYGVGGCFRVRFRRRPHCKPELIQTSHNPGEALSALTKEPLPVGSCSAPLEFIDMPQIKTLPSTADAISKPSSPSLRPQGSGTRDLSWRFAAVLEGAGRRRRFCSPSIMFCLTQFQQSASISTRPRRRLLDLTLVSTAEPGSFSRVTYAGSGEPIRAPGIRNQLARPRGREAKQPDLGTI
jgi:hypothetical protein